MLYAKDIGAETIKRLRKPQHPVPLNSLEDIKKYPNDILLNYAISGEQWDAPKLAELFCDLNELSTWLELYSPSQEKEVAQYALAGIGIAAYDQGNVLVLHGNLALKAQAIGTEYAYPSGLHIPYYLLAGEQAANISAFHAGFSIPDRGHIFLSANALITMQALCAVAQENPDFKEYERQMTSFTDYIAGIVLAHEVSELTLIKSNKRFNFNLEQELESERLGLQFLKENQVDPTHYELFHVLRAAQDDEGGLNISKRALSYLEKKIEIGRFDLKRR